jgi:hypothetical protein
VDAALRIVATGGKDARASTPHHRECLLLSLGLFSTSVLASCSASSIRCIKIVQILFRGSVQRFARGCDASPSSCPGGLVCANTSHDEPALTLARKRIPLFAVRALFHSSLSRGGGFRILQSIFGHREFSILFRRRYIRKPRKRSTLGRSNRGWQTAQIEPSLEQFDLLYGWPQTLVTGSPSGQSLGLDIKPIRQMQAGVFAASAMLRVRD